MLNFLAVLLSGTFSIGSSEPAVGDLYGCGPVSDGVEYSRKYLWVVDGEILSKDAGHNLLQGRIRVEQGWLVADGFHSYRILCDQVFDRATGRLVRVQGIGWLQSTESLVEPAVELLLSRISDFQALHHESNGAFAYRWNLPRMFQQLFPSEGLTVRVEEDGWSATIDYSDTVARTICHIAVGEIERPHRGLVSGVPACFSEREDRLASSHPRSRGGIAMR